MTTSDFAVLVDLDGTLVDSVYHHVLAWDAALSGAGHTVPLARIHAGIGMGGERLVPWLLGEHPEGGVAALKDEHELQFLRHAGRLRPTPGARALLDDLERREVAFRIATSATGEIRDALLSALGHDDLPGVDADEVDAPKPAPDLLLAACEDLGVQPERAMLVGDSPWDAEAGARIGMRTVAVRCGGFAASTLRAAGAVDVVEDPGELVGRL